MTYSIVARCARTGQLGAAGTTSDIAIGARVPWLAAGVGAVVTQHRTDPRLGPHLLASLAAGADAEAAIEAAVASTPDARWRQLAAVPAAGPGAAFSGGLVDRAFFAEIVAADHIVVGNVLADPEVGQAVSREFTACADQPLAERMVRALQSGLEAGGEQWPLRSAYLKVVAVESFPLVDLRVDEHDRPLAELRRLWDLYRPLTDQFVARALTPDSVPT